MEPRSRLGLLLLALVLALPSLAAQPTADAGGPEPGQVLATLRLAPGETNATDERTVLLEVFSATWCPPCAPADRALDRLLGARSDLHVVTYHPWPDTGFRGGDEDPFGFPEGSNRMRDKYDAFWFPSVYADGILAHTPDARDVNVSSGAEGLYEAAYGGLVDARRDAPLEARIEASARMEQRPSGTNLHVEGRAVRITRSVEPLTIVAVLTEDPIHFRGGNGEPTHRHVARALEEVSWPEGEQEASFSWSFPAQPGWSADNLSVTLLVESPWRAAPQGPTASTFFAWSLGALLASGATYLLLARRPRRRGPADTLPLPARLRSGRWVGRAAPVALVAALLLLLAVPMAEGKLTQARLEGESLVVEASALPPEIQRITLTPAMAKRGEDVHVAVDEAEGGWDRADVLYCRVEPSYNCGMPFRLERVDGMRFEGAIRWAEACRPRTCFLDEATRTVGVNVSLSRGVGDGLVQVLAPREQVGLGVEGLPPEVDANYVFYLLSAESGQAPGPALLLVVAALAAPLLPGRARASAAPNAPRGPGRA